MTQTHPHPVNGTDVERAREAGLGDAEAHSSVSCSGCSPTRCGCGCCSRLVAVDELCVGDLAAALGISMDQSSYGLKQLRTAGMVQVRRDGRVMYYRLADGFPHQLLDHCLRQLLTIAIKEGRS